MSNPWQCFREESSWEFPRNCWKVNIHCYKCTGAIFLVQNFLKIKKISYTVCVPLVQFHLPITQMHNSFISDKYSKLYYYLVHSGN